MWEFKHQISINSSTDAVFDLIADLDGYKDWNPFLVEASGSVEPGGVVKGKSNLGWTVTPFKHRIFEIKPGQSLCWRDFGFAAKFVCGERSRYVESRDGSTLFLCELKLTGHFAGVIDKLFGKGLREGVAAEAQALKQLAEQGL